MAAWRAPEEEVKKIIGSSPEEDEDFVSSICEEGEDDAGVPLGCWRGHQIKLILECSSIYILYIL